MSTQGNWLGKWAGGWFGTAKKAAQVVSGAGAAGLAAFRKRVREESLRLKKKSQNSSKDVAVKTTSAGVDNKETPHSEVLTKASLEILSSEISVIKNITQKEISENNNPEADDSQLRFLLLLT